MVLFPVLLMLFALAMERVEYRLSRLAVRETEVATYIDHATTAEVATMAGDTLPDALARLHLRMDLAEVELEDPVGAARRAS